MAYLIIFLAMFLVIGPVLWLRPSKRERELAQLRQVVMADGAKIHPVNIRRDPNYSATLERNPHLADYSWIRYQWIANENETGPDLKDTWVQRKDKEKGLVWEPRSVKTKETPAIQAILDNWRNAQDVRFLALELGPRSVSIVWNERGDQQEVLQLAKQVRGLFRPAA